ncbi:hypothetical protein [Paraburkholderia dinghuensis]|uniref:hypothetical protein n=1 Tax=Paraburkholderia dinghuensis TaxID=2305225 RepID=UPI001FE51128|nr:hypothetical protein [Paraburkholderia dinghuensis]
MDAEEIERSVEGQMADAERPFERPCAFPGECGKLAGIQIYAWGPLPIADKPAICGTRPGALNHRFILRKRFDGSTAALRAATFVQLVPGDAYLELSIGYTVPDVEARFALQIHEAVAAALR